MQGRIPCKRRSGSKTAKVLATHRSPSIGCFKLPGTYLSLGFSFEQSKFGGKHLICRHDRYLLAQLFVFDSEDIARAGGPLTRRSCSRTIQTRPCNRGTSRSRGAPLRFSRSAPLRASMVRRCSSIHELPVSDNHKLKVSSFTFKPWTFYESLQGPWVRPRSMNR